MRGGKFGEGAQNDLDQFLWSHVSSHRPSAEYLRVLEDPNFDTYLDRLIESGQVKPDVAATLRGARNGGALYASTYSPKVERIRQQRHEGLARVNAGWLGLAVTGVVVSLVLLWMWAPAGCAATTIVIALLVLLAAIMLPSLGAARRTARQMQANTEMRGLAQALELDKQAGTPSAAMDSDAVDSQAASPVRLRQWFPETLLWRPELITDDQGRVSLDIDLADSITTWRLSASAVSAQGRLGALQSSLRVFQPFFVDLNLPVVLTRGDLIAVPVVIYNYLDRPQQVQLTLENSDWFTLLDEPTKQVTLAAQEVRSVSFRFRADRAGLHAFKVQARGDAGVADAIQRQIEIVPDGKRLEMTQSGSLARPVTVTVDIPSEIIDSSVKATLRLYPTALSQVVEGLDGIFQRPSGCFEQTSSTTYPNVLVLDYLRRTGKNAPAVEAKAQQYIHLGYQRLLGFEVPGGGFDWFGRAPANQGLSAYGLMEFQDMAKVHEVDPKLIERTRQWLLKQRNADGTWTPESHMFNNVRHGSDVKLSTTAYVAWAVFGDGQSTPQALTTLNYLQDAARNVESPYVLALVCNALIAMDPSGDTVRPHLSRLVAMAKTSSDGKMTWWDTATGERTTFYGSGRSATVETTALATLALIHTRQSPTAIRGALAWLAAQKDPNGTWHSTQATVLVMKALLASAGKPLGDGMERRIELQIDNGAAQQIVIAADQAEVVKQMDLTPYLPAGTHRIQLRDVSGADVGYQVAWRYHVPSNAFPVARETEPLTIDVVYDRTQLEVGHTLHVATTVTNHMIASAPMVMLDLPIPAGFAVSPNDFDQLVQSGAIAKFQLTPRSVIVYLRNLNPATPLTLRYGLLATMPVEVTAPPSKVYEYYNADLQGTSSPQRLIIGQRI